MVPCSLLDLAGYQSNLPLKVLIHLFLSSQLVELGAVIGAETGAQKKYVQIAQLFPDEDL